MSHELRFQVLNLPNVAWHETLARYKLIEELGFELAGVADHFVDWTKPERPWFEAWTVLAAVAQATSRLKLTTFVAQIPLRNPAMFARQALTLDHISGGRLEIGLGIGLTSDPSYEMAGLPNWTNPQRVARFGEYVEIVDQLLTNEVTTYEGKYYQVKGAVINPRPVQLPRPPLCIAAFGPVMLKKAAQYADIWNSLSFSDSFATQLQETKDRTAIIDEQCAAIGRDPTTLRRSYLMFDAGSRATGGLVNYYESEDLFVDMVNQVTELGVSEIGVYYPTLPEQLPKFEHLATHVLPKLRKAYAASH